MSRGDRGAATVWTLALLAVLLLAGLLAAAVAQQAIARQRVASAADMAALAAAQAVGDACTEAARTAAANVVRLDECALDGADIWVRVSVPTPALVRRLNALLGTGSADVSVVARAGPPGGFAIPPGETSPD